MGCVCQQASHVSLDQAASKVEELPLGRHYFAPGGDLHNKYYFKEKIEETKHIESAYAEHGKVLLVDYRALTRRWWRVHGGVHALSILPPTAVTTTADTFTA